MRESPDCLRCGTRMNYLGDRKLQLGQTGWVLGDLPNLLAGSMELALYSCPSCGKVEFFQADGDGAVGKEATGYEAAVDKYGSDGLPQVRCPRCGKIHDVDYPKCPFCKYDRRSIP